MSVDIDNAANTPTGFTGVDAAGGVTSVTVPNGSGGTDEYGIEGMSPNYLARVGWDKHTLNSGDKVELVIHPLRDGRKGGFDVSVKFSDGKLIYNLPHGP